MGRRCHFFNGFNYKFWFACQDSGFDFLEEIVGVDEQEYYIVDRDCDDDEFIEWWGDDESNDCVLLSDVVERPGFNHSWLDYFHEAGTYQFEMSVNSDTLLQFINEKYSEFQIPKFQDYEMNTDGTTKLCNTICDQYETIVGDTSKQADFCLACVIYHMSLYDDNISGEYH